MNKRALVIAAVVAALGAVLLVIYMKRFEQEVSGGERIQVLMAIKPIEAGDVISEDALAVREIPIAYVEDRSVKAAEKNKVVGLRVGNKVQAQQSLLWTDLAIASDERRDLSALIQPGNRAVSIRAQSGDKSYALIRPGDYVDVIANLPTAQENKRTSVVLLQKILVLAVGLETAPKGLLEDQEKGTVGSREMLLTLSVGLQEAQLLSLATEKGLLEVALRNPQDPQTLEGIADMSSTTLTDQEVRQTVQKSKPSGPVRLEAER